MQSANMLLNSRYELGTLAEFSISCEKSRRLTYRMTTSLPHRRYGGKGAEDDITLDMRHELSYRLVYCGALRARLRPYFLRSLTRGSRVR